MPSHFLRLPLAANPSYEDALLALGECRLALHEPQQALAPLQKVVTLGSNAQAHYVLGTALIQLGRTAEGAHEREICGQMRAAERAHANP